MKTQLTPPETRALLTTTLEYLVSQRDALNELDKALGDGDHGSTMARGAAAAITALAAADPAAASVNALFTAVGTEMLNSMGGASGVLFGVFFRGAGAGPAAAQLDGTSLADCLQKGLTDLQARTPAKPGDKTMLDALVPAVGALVSHREQPLEAALAAAAEAASTGAQSTRGMLPKLGRARTLGERARAAVDPGATSIEHFFRQLHTNLPA